MQCSESSTSLRMSFQSDSVSLNLFQEAYGFFFQSASLVSGISKHLCLSEGAPQKFLLFTPGKEGPGQSGQFQGRSEIFLIVYNLN